MNLLRRVYYFFSPYSDVRERRVARFFRSARESKPHKKIQYSLLSLMQDNVAVLNLWSEYRYRGYRYLRKKKRRELYRNLAIIEQNFEDFMLKEKNNEAVFVSELKKAQLDTNQLHDQELSALRYLWSIMHYLSPQRGLYEYQASSSFGRLLANPHAEKLVGDCNQIVTLYVYLFSKRYPIDLLQLQLPPGHVALHCAGIDIEATTASFVPYNENQMRHLAPIQELAAVNLLDVTDENLTKKEVSADVFLESARLAYVVSGDRELVRKNLAISYQNATAQCMQRGMFKRAMKYAKQSQQQDLIEQVAAAGINHTMARHNFSTARWLADYSLKKYDFLRSIAKNEAVFLYKQTKFADAAKLFKTAGEHHLAQKAYAALFLEEQKKLHSVKTVDDLKNHAATVKKMQYWAKKSGDTRLIDHAKKLASQL